MFPFLLGHNVPRCIHSDPNSKPDHNCLNTGDVQDAIDIYTILRPELFKRAVTHYCRDANVKPYMTEVEIIHFIKQNYGLKVSKVLILVYYCLQFFYSITGRKQNHKQSKEFRSAVVCKS